jgi:hypothetical protein
MFVGVDFDNTVVCYDKLFYQLALERQLIPAELPQRKSAVRDYLRRTGAEELWIELQGVGYGARILEAEPFAGASEFFCSLREHGLGACIVSHKTRHPIHGARFDLHRAAHEWLGRNGFYSTGVTGLGPNSVFLEHSRSSKLERIRRLDCRYFVDDLPEFLAEARFPAATQRVLFDPSGQHGATPGLLRVTSWSELGSLLLDARAVA